MEYTVNQIGMVRADDEGFRVELLPEYIPALKGLDKFGYVLVVWWFDGCDNEADRARRVERKPYKAGPDALGVFATRSPMRPNPVAVSAARALSVDEERGVITLAYIDADDFSPVLDIKPYTPSLDRAEAPDVPKWCAHWPKSIEASGEFDWSGEFNFQ